MKKIKHLPGFEYLKELEVFDPNAFVSQNVEEQKVCNFVLSLSLIYNDLKDIVWSMENMREVEVDSDEKTPRNGQIAGFRLHIMKLYYSIYNELFELIWKNKAVIKHALFQETVKVIPKPAKNSWKSLCDVVLTQNTDNKKLKNTYDKIRNKTTYHYTDSKSLISGYKKFFYDAKGNKSEDAFISRGANMAGTRFYYIDAAVNQYIVDKVGENPEVFFDKTNELFDDINVALFQICTKFINITRKKPWKKYV